MNPTPVPRPSQDPAPPQWEQIDIDAALAQGKPELIDQARQNGQLDNLLRNGNGTPHGADHVPGIRSMDLEMAAQILATKVPPEGASDATSRAYTEPIKEA